MPLLSVVMSTYNRENIVSETIESILNQTFTDFEFIIIDDCSVDGTFDLINSYNDSRIKLFKNYQNKGCTFNYHVGHNISSGQYVAHTDDDDISFPDRFEKQLEYLQENKDISLLGTFIETFGENARPSWVLFTEPEKIDFLMNFYNPFCHSSIIYDKRFADRNFINYNLRCKCSQDYDFYKQFILKNGKIANISETLVRYRMHKKRLTDVFETQQIQISVAENVKKEMLLRFFEEQEITELKQLLKEFPYNDYNIENSVKAFKQVKERALNLGFYNSEMIDSVIEDLTNGLFKF